MGWMKYVVFGALCAFATAPAWSVETLSDGERLEAAENNEWLSISGTVEASFDDNFLLNYGSGFISVEMDDYDWYNENVLLSGDKVSVTGRMDDDVFEVRTIEASSVYVERLNEFFYASAIDEEDGPYAFPAFDSVWEGERISVTGIVASRDGDSLDLDTGFGHIDVDTARIERDLNIEAGDRVSVYGAVEEANIFEVRELRATSVIRLSHGS